MICTDVKLKLEFFSMRFLQIQISREIKKSNLEVTITIILNKSKSLDYLKKKNSFNIISFHVIRLRKFESMDF